MTEAPDGGAAGMGQPPDGGSWITLGRARRLLGVNESTLRRWADSGQIRSFRTPGGHRRFSEADLRLLMAGGVHRGEPQDRYRTLGELALSRIRRRLQHPRGADVDWTSGIDEQGRSHLRETGRRLVALTSEYLARRHGRSRLIEEAHQIGGEYGMELARNGLHLRDAVAAFTFFRRSLEETAKQLAQRQQLSSEEAAQSWELINALGDEVLIALTDAYETARAGAR